MELLLTGATGFVGRNFLLSILKLKKYSRIFAPVRDPERLRGLLKQDGLSNLPPELEIIRASAQDWNLGPAANVEHVVHAAGVIFARTREEYWDTNVEGTVRLLKALRNPAQVVVLSSLAAAGPSRAGAPRLESDSASPVTWYGQSKLEMEKRIREEFPKVPCICLRPPMIFGPRDHATLPLFKMVRKPVHFKAGFRTKYYSILSVEDLVAGIERALESPAIAGMRTYFIAHPEVITDRQLLAGAAQVCGTTSRVLAVPQFLLKAASRVVDHIPTWRTTIPSLSVDRAKEIWPDHWVVSSQAFERDFGWRASVPFLESLKRTRDWYIRTGQLVA